MERASIRRLGWRRSSALTLFMALIFAGCSSSSMSALIPKAAHGSRSTSASPIRMAVPVPSEYKQQYSLLSSDISALRRETGPTATNTTILATELQLANGNFGAYLLSPGYEAIIDDELSDFKAMHIRAVVVNVAFPLLLPTYPNSTRYASFYEQVAQRVHADGMQLTIEENPIIPTLSAAPVSGIYGSLTVDSYAADQRAEAQIIIDDLHPQYLDLLDEVSTFSMDLGLHFDSDQEVKNLLTMELEGLSRGSTQIGAGIGTWEPTSLEQAIASITGIDYLSVHYYPTSATGPAQLASLKEVLSIAHASHLRVHMDETWISKSPAGASLLAGAAIDQKLQTFNFWEPLDAAYLQAIVGYCRTHGISLVSPFGSNDFFSYVIWTPTVDAEPSVAVSHAEIETVIADVPSLAPTQVGMTYAALASRDVLKPR